MLDPGNSGVAVEAVAPAPRRAPLAGPSLLLVANENASGIGGRRETVEQVASLLRRQGATVEATSTASTRELDEIVSEEQRRIVLLGGDGTLHAVANVHGPKPEVALIPFGRANNIARALGVPLAPERAAALAVHGRSLALDGIAVEAPGVSMTALEGVSAGFHALARARYRGVNSADTAAGIAAAVRAFARFRPVQLALAVDGDCELRRVGQLFVANFPLYGPRLPVAPSADPTDGMLELVEIDAGGRLSLAAELAHLKRGTHVERNGVRIRSARRVRIATDESPVIADTTVLSTGPVDLAVQPHTIQVVGAAS